MSRCGLADGNGVFDLHRYWVCISNGLLTQAFLGIFCLLLLIVFIEEPARGASEHAHVESSSIRQDLTYLWSMFV